MHSLQPTCSCCLGDARPARTVWKVWKQAPMTLHSGMTSHGTIQVADPFTYPTPVLLRVRERNRDTGRTHDVCVLSQRKCEFATQTVTPSLVILSQDFPLQRRPCVADIAMATKLNQQTSWRGLALSGSSREGCRGSEPSKP